MLKKLVQYSTGITDNVFVFHCTSTIQCVCWGHSRLPSLVAVFIFARNPTLTKEEIENNLREYLGVDTVIWLGKGAIGDVDTDGHVDNLLAFVRPGEVSNRLPLTLSELQRLLLTSCKCLVPTTGMHRLMFAL